MSEEIHNTQTPAEKHSTEHWLVDGFKKQFLGIAIGAAIAVGSYFWNSHDNGKDLKYQVESNTKAIAQLVIAGKEQSDAQNQIVISLTKVSEAQNRLANDVRDIQQQQQRNTEMLLNRK